ncbi:hypothetical protein F2Q70_00017270 [Brassica cretica]|uniref:Uncharacterized protein n=1 Tax=Brassica cretica TaxID=69181 RepID=A0A8S9I4E0_BRACR|nr:hypothetical protein F2Q70_00017270 [Brassica cretica]
MNFPNRRFSSPSIREYQTSKGDSGPRKKRPEPKPIIRLNMDLSAFQKNRNQEKWPRNYDVMIHSPNLARPKTKKLSLLGQETEENSKEAAKCSPHGKQLELAILNEPKVFPQSTSCPNQKHYKLDQTEVFMSDHASPTGRVIPSDHPVHVDHNFPLDRADQTVCTDPSDHPDRTARAVHRIDPRTSVLELSLEPPLRDGFDQPTSLLSQPIQHYNTDSQARFNLGREESEDVHRFSLLALLVRHACPEGCPDVLASVPDPLMDISHTYFTNAWKLSCLETCLTPVHILVMKINRRVMWRVRRVGGSSRVCPILPIMNLHDQNEPGHQLKSYFHPDLEIKSL